MQKVYLITGSTSGIGKALLEEYSKENLVLAGYRDESKKIDFWRDLKLVKEKM